MTNHQHERHLCYVWRRARMAAAKMEFPGDRFGRNVWRELSNELFGCGLYLMSGNELDRRRSEDFFDLYEVAREHASEQEGISQLVTRGTNQCA